MNFDIENLFDLNDVLDHLDDGGHQPARDDADAAKLFEEVL